MDRQSPILLRTMNLSMSSLESDVLLSEVYDKLARFRDEEKATIITSWLAISFSDLMTAETNDALSQYVVHLRLFNTLVNNSSFEKASELADLFSKKFLVDFILPSVKDNSQRISRLSAATGFFQIACENINQPLLVRKVVGLVTAHLLPILTERLLSDDKEILVCTLGLFKTLLEFYCEDFWYELILQYLLPMKYLMVADRQKAVGDINYLESSVRFINAVPSCITGSTSPEALAQHYVMYIDQELARLQEIDLAQSKGIPLSKSIVSGIHNFDDESFDDSNSSRNPFFPLWAFKYDGTDVLYASRSFKTSEPEEYLEDGQFIFPVEKEEDILKQRNMNSSLNNHFDMAEYSDFDSPSPSSEGSKSPIDDYTSPSQDDISSSINNDGDGSPLAQASNSFDQTRRRKDSTSFSHSSYLGPFLNNLYKLLNKWTSLDPEVLIMISDIVSIFAASRLPLLSSLFLDTNIILQPCYPSFTSDIHSIAASLDSSMGEYPTWFVKQMWQQASSGALNILETQQKLEEQESNNKKTTADVLKARFLNSRPFSFVSKLSGGSAAAIANIAKIISDGSSVKENRVLNRSASGFESKEEEAAARSTTIRSILFTHWMLELSAISHQQCWSQPQSRFK